jgi:hypothetical protein
MLLAMCFALQLAQSAFNVTPRFLLREIDNLFTFALAGFFVALALLVGFYVMAVRGTSPRRLSVAGVTILTAGYVLLCVSRCGCARADGGGGRYVMLVSSLLALASQVAGYPLVGSQPERVRGSLGCGVLSVCS